MIRSIAMVCWMSLRVGALGSAALAGLAPTVALAADEDGIPVTVRVLDATTGEPIPTAVVRHPSEQDRHRVNTENGEWTGSVLYMPDGSELFFTKGMSLDFEVSAPGYLNGRFTYVVRKRRNSVEFALQKMEIDMSEEDPDDITIQFGRDKPID
ncbi:MAG: hypothetical protein ABMA64_28685 [Myxococcota bacterium]